jgi:NADPH-dependent 2,4-dienoyl-CoA reductase/sulfur reductase-like enzyme
MVIGADAAGLSAVGQIKRRQPQAKIKVINKGEIISYGACGIPYVISGDIASPQKLIHFTPDSFESMRGVPVETLREAVGLSPEEHEVVIKDLDTGEVSREGYRKLLIATGAAPKRLPFIDYDLDGIFNVHTIPDLKQILAFFEERKPRRAAVIGAGSVGLEVAEAMVKRGLQVQLFDIFPEPAIVWPPLVRKAVTEKIREKGIQFHGGTALKSVERRGEGLVLKTDDQEYKTDVLFSVVGTAPATSFCRDVINTKKNGAIVTDRTGLTSDKDIYAAGDCAAVYHRILNRNVHFPLGSTANKMGRVAGINMAGGRFEFPGIVGTQILKFFELSLAKTGLSQEEAEKEGIAARSFKAQRTDKAAYFPGSELAKVEVICEEDGGAMLGAVAVCSSNAAHFIDPAAVAVYMGMSIEDLGWFDSAYAPPFSPVWNALISAALKASRS